MKRITDKNWLYYAVVLVALIVFFMMPAQKAAAESGRCNHVWESVSAREPTCTDDGYTAHMKCSICAEVNEEYQVIPALGHDFVVHEAQAATCTQAGNSAYWICSRCRKFFRLEKNEEDGTVTETEIEKDSWIIEPDPSAHRETLVYMTVIYLRYDCEICGSSRWEYNRASRNLIPGLVRNSAGEKLDYITGAGVRDGNIVLAVTPECAELNEEGICLCLTMDEFQKWTQKGLKSIEMKAGEYLMNIDLTALSLPEGTEELIFTVRTDGTMEVERVTSSDMLWDTMQSLLEAAPGGEEPGRAVTLKRQEENSSDDVWDAISDLMDQLEETADN